MLSGYARGVLCEDQVTDRKPFTQAQDGQRAAYLASAASCFALSSLSAVFLNLSRNEPSLRGPKQHPVSCPVDNATSNRSQTHPE